MKKSFVDKFAVLFGILLIGTGLVFQLNASAAVDYSGGLLDGKSAKLVKPSNFDTKMSDYETSTEISSAMTDNNDKTYTTLYANQSSSSNYNKVMAVFKFETEVEVNSYILSTNERGVSISFFDSTGTWIPMSWGANPDGTLHEFEKIKGVRYVALTNPSSNISANVKEFNVFGSVMAQPEPQPEPEPNQPSVNRAIFVLTLTNGLEKEYDLSMQEVNSFIDWYETKQAGSGKASYAIDKHENNKGPFKIRKDYILFDRVLTFEVSEY